MTPTTAPAPEPGQRVWIEAEIVATDRGPRVRTICAGPGYPGPGYTDNHVAWFDLPEVVWHPADVPPQPPVLAWGTTVRLATSETPYVVSTIENHCDWPDCRQMTVRLWSYHSDAQKLADVPGPDDTTPEAHHG